MFLKTMQQTKRVLKIVFGFALLFLGVIMVIAPGPGWLTIVLGLGILAAEFVWARRLLDRMKQQGARLKEQGIRLREAILSRGDPATPR
ncbi:MAG TPA: PGPGW domain-containing protein [Candidatus Acidoferrales bacterium]|nr:PGPGW domain-containing protein [Candidatus Acidoferrales bacterium]